MAGRRPRLVHEGSPIIDEDDDPHAGSSFHRPSVATLSSSSVRIRDNIDRHHGARREQENGVVQNNVASSLLSARGGGGASINKYKLQTKFVVGGGIDPPPPTASACFRHFSIDTTPSSYRPSHGHHVRVTDDRSNLLHTRAGGVATSDAHKLRTTLVVGGGDSVENDDSDDVMMDEDERDHHGRLRERHDDIMDGRYPTSHERGSGGRHSHDNRHTPIGAVEHQQRMPQYPNPNGVNPDGHYNFASVNPMHDDKPTAAHIPAPIYHMPSPSLSPLVVLDGANIAYNYSDCLNPNRESQTRQPDPRGISIAIEYFLQHDCRVQAVVPVSWYRLKPRPADRYHLDNRSRGDSSDARMVTEEVEELRGLRRGGFLVAVPPGDDDDAYAMALARREDDRVLEQRVCARRRDDGTIGMMVDDETSSSRHHLPLGGYVVSNDMFHDAIRRDDIGHYRQNQLLLPLNARPVFLKGWLARKRISYSFANVGTTSQSDDRIRLDFVPNPRSDLIEAIDACGRLKIGMR
jgi:hypothetical protein